ncbi:MAG: CHASE domain-containing protein [Nitrosomonadales bacterium]|nr:CHASE domain-containing protein [Nitrosomonadales bacterium]
MHNQKAAVIRSALMSNPMLARILRVLEWHRLGLYLPGMVLFFTLFATYQLWDIERQEVEEELQVDFDSRARETTSNIRQRMHTYAQMLYGVQGLFAASGIVGRDKFYSYVSALHLEENFPGIQGMGFSLIVQSAEMRDHIAALRKEGLTAYAIQPEGRRKMYAPGIYVEPFSESNIRSLGVDNYADPVRRAAMEMARDTDQPTNSGKVLLQEIDGHVRAGFLMFLPIYRSGVPHDTLIQRRANIIGWVYASSRIRAIMEGIRGEGYSDIDIEMHDGDDISDESLMYDSDSSNSHLAKGSQALFRGRNRLEIANHFWTLSMHSLPNFDYQLEGGKPRVIAYLGICASALLTMLTWLLVYGRARALADSAEISMSEARYRQMFEENASIAYLLDPDTGHIVDANTAALKFWGYTLEELRGMNISKISMVPSGKIIEVMEQIKGGATHRLELLHRTKSGEIHDVEVFSGPLTRQGKTLRYSIAHDITARKRAEEGERIATTVFNTVEDAVVVTDPGNNIVAVNPAFTTITGYAAEEVMGKNPKILGSGEHSPEFFRKMWDKLNTSGSWHGEIVDRNKSGETYTKWLSIKLVRDESGKITHHVAVFSDIRERRRHPRAT